MRRDKTTGQFTRAATPAAGPSPAKLRAALDAALTAASPLASAAAPVETDGGIDDRFGWIRAIESGPDGQKIALEAAVYELDRQYQLLPPGNRWNFTGVSRFRGTPCPTSHQPGQLSTCFFSFF